MAADLLTGDLWKLVLKHVPQKDRLCGAALTSRCLANAAAAATDALVLTEMLDDPEAEARYAERPRKAGRDLMPFLERHGSNLTSIKLSGYVSRPLVQLPCANLVELDISCSDSREAEISTSFLLQLGPRNGLPGMLSACAGSLTRLELSMCRVVDVSGLSGFSHLVNLKHLQLHVVEDGVNRPESRWLFGALPGSILPSLSHLTCLDTSDMFIDEVHCVSQLSALAVLDMSLKVGQSYGCMYYYVHPHIDLSRATLPGLSLPGSLVELVVDKCVMVDPAVLATATRLTHLFLDWVELTKAANGRADAAALLAALSALQNLVVLKIGYLEHVDWPAPGAVYEGLTASSKLQKLEVSCPGIPQALLRHAFAPGRVLPSLQFVTIADTESTWDWGAEDVSHVVASCVGLQHLRLSVADSQAVAELSSLTTLTWLMLSFAAWRDRDGSLEAVVQAGAALTTLRSLHLSLFTGRDSVVDRSSVLPLTSLCALTSFSAHGLLPYYGGVELKAGPSKPPVWQQLQEWCLRDSQQPPRRALPAAAPPQPDNTAWQEQQEEAEELVIEQLSQQAAHLLHDSE